MEIKIIRSKRRTLGLEVNADGVTVRAPMFVSDSEIERFLCERRSWIEKNLEKIKKQRQELENNPPLSFDEIKKLAEKAREVIPGRVDFYARKIGVNYGKITIRNQRTKWGSCSGKGNLNFNCLLMLAPPEVLDSVVVHELCHLKEMNHSDRFYAEVLRAFPDYRRCEKWLKENGGRLLWMAGEGKSRGE